MDPRVVDADEERSVRRSNRRHLVGLALALFIFGLIPVVLMVLDLVQR